MNTDRFKFRVWDSEIKQYFKYHEGHENTCFITMDGQIHCDAYGTLIIEQCTGLTDKLGKLIYEGDIVNLSPADSEVHKNRLVCWCRDHWGTKELGSPDVWSFSPLDEIEIIGNIHERS